jgi:hypothetical protein
MLCAPRGGRHTFHEPLADTFRWKDCSYTPGRIRRLAEGRGGKPEAVTASGPHRDSVDISERSRTCFRIFIMPLNCIRPSLSVQNTSATLERRCCKLRESCNSLRALAGKRSLPTSHAANSAFM